MFALLLMILAWSVPAPALWECSPGTTPPPISGDAPGSQTFCTKVHPRVIRRSHSKVTLARWVSAHHL